MRSLTIKRNKSFVACLGKMKVYVEDSASASICINGVMCRKLGDLKNGEEKTFEVPCESVRVFVIADTVSKDFCNDSYLLPEGDEPIVLTGKCKYNPAAGNAFRFDNNTNEEALTNRKKGTKKGVVIIAVAAIVGFIVGIGAFSGVGTSSRAKDKTFSSNGIKITLTENFKEDDEIENMTASYVSNTCGVFLLKEKFSAYPGLDGYTLEQYADAVIRNNGKIAELREKDGIYYFEYTFENNSDGNTYYYMCCVYKTDNAFWTISFSTLESKADNYFDTFMKWAKSVEFYG